MVAAKLQGAVDHIHLDAPVLRAAQEFFHQRRPVAIGLAYSPWHLTNPELLAGAIALASVVILYINLRDSELGTPTLMFGGAAYTIFLIGLWNLGAL